MTSSLYKPVYVTKPTLITRNSDSQLDSLNETEKYHVSPMSTLDSNSKNLHSNIDQCSTASEISLPATLLSNFVSTSELSLKKNKTITIEDDESEHLYIARPYKCWRVCPRRNSFSPNPRFRSLSSSKTYGSESVFRQKVQCADKAHSVAATCKSHVRSLQFINQLFGKRLVNEHSLKSAQNFYLTVPSFNDGKPFQGYSSIRRGGPNSASFHSASMRSSLSIQLSNLRSYTPYEEDTTTFVSLSKSLDCRLESNTTPESDRPRSGNGAEPNASMKISSESYILDRVNKSEGTKSFFAQMIKAKAHISPDFFKNEVLRFKPAGVNHWVPCGISDPEAKRMLFSELYLGQSIPGILPIQLMEYTQIYDVHASYASAIISGPVLTANPILKVMDVLKTEIGPIQSKFLAVDNDLMANEINICSPQKGRSAIESVASYQFKTVDITLFKDYAPSICLSEFWPNVVLMDNDHTTRISQAERTLTISPILLGSSCGIPCSGTFTPQVHLKQVSYSAVGSSNGPNQFILNRRIATTSNESSYCSVTTAFKCHPISEIFSKFAEDREHRKSDFMDNSGCLFAETPANDLKCVPAVSEQDEPSKLTKDITSYHQAGDYNSVVSDNNPLVQVDMKGGSKLSSAKLTYLWPKIPTNTDDCESVDSSILVAEGYPGGWNDDKEKSDIHLNCTAAPGPSQIKKTGKLNDTFTLISHGPKKDLVTSVSDVAHALNDENAMNAKSENAESTVPTIKREEIKDGEVIQEVKLDERTKNVSLCETKLAPQSEKELKRNFLRRDDKDDIKQDSGESQSAGGALFEPRPISPLPASTCRSCLVPRTGLGGSMSQTSSLARNDYVGFRRMDAYTLKKRKLRMLMKKCKYLRREPPLHPFLSYPYSSYMYYPPPPPALPQPHYMASPPWDFRNYRFSKQHRQHKPRRSSRHHHHRHRKASSYSKHNTKKEAKNSASNVRQSITIPGPPRPSYHSNTMSITRSPQISPNLVVYQPPFNEGPSGTYHLPEAGVPPFNPFKGHSLPNEPLGFVKTCFSPSSPPTTSKVIPPVEENVVPNQGNQSHSYPSDRKPTNLGQLPPDSESSLEELLMTSRPPYRRMAQRNVQQRQPLSAIMGPGAPNHRLRSPPTAAGPKVDGPQVTSTGEKYGLFRLPLNQNEYTSCEERFDWLQSEKTLLETSLNKLEAENGMVDHPEQRLTRGPVASKEETRITNALNQIEREMAALRLVMKKYTNERKKGLFLKTTTF
ncbi:hypothetical protein Aperf_G00000035232 [Anoplocephala perfoliata]